MTAAKMYALALFWLVCTAVGWFLWEDYNLNGVPEGKNVQYTYVMVMYAVLYLRVSFWFVKARNKYMREMGAKD